MTSGRTTHRSGKGVWRFVIAVVLLVLSSAPTTEARCVVVALIDQFACNQDVQPLLEAISACLYPHFCNGQRRRRLRRRRKLDDWETTRMETHKHLKDLGLRLVHPTSVCNSTEIIERVANETNQTNLKECMYLDVEIFTNGTFVY
mmetsp:Transcript_29140/g.79998  ORF Transcript_29140/g.79998 Transcript_29140/m.79998 type:complete len:146 (-) Transcript_29140:394-831(-)